MIALGIVRRVIEEWVCIFSGSVPECPVTVDGVVERGLVRRDKVHDVSNGRVKFYYNRKDIHFSPSGKFLSFYKNRQANHRESIDRILELSLFM